MWIYKKTKDKDLQNSKSKIRFISSGKRIEKGSSLKVFVVLMQFWVSIFKTAKPSSLGLDHSRRGCLKDR